MPVLGNPTPVVLTDQNGNVQTGSASNASVGTTGAPAPAAATEVGIIDGSGNLQGISAANPLPISGSISATNPSVGSTGSTAPTSATELGVVDNSGKLQAASSSNPVRIDPVGTTIQPVSAASLPLPTGAATSALQSTGNTSLASIVAALTNPLPVSVASLPALAAGSAVIGKVGIDQTTPGTTNGVQINAALPAGTNTIGTVTTPVSTTSGACANTAVASTSGQLLASNSSRKQVMIVNTDVVTVYLGLGQTPTATAYHAALAPCSTAHDGTGGSYISDLWTGAINAIVASTGGHVSVTELT